MIHEVVSTDSRTGRKRRARRQNILDAAMALVTEGGLDGLTVGHLARALDYTPGALYRYFDSKEAIVVELQRSAIARIDGELGRVLADLAEGATAKSQVDRALERLCAAARFYAALPLRLPHELHLLQATIADPRHLVGDALAASVFPSVRGILERMNAEFEAAARCGALARGRAAQRTLVFWSSLQGIVQLGKLGRFDAKLFDVSSLGSELVRALLLGWGADAGALDRALAHRAGAAPAARSGGG